MSNKVLTAEDLVVGKRYVPHKKSVGGSRLDNSICWRLARVKKQPYLYYVGYDGTNHMFNEYPTNKVGDFFLPSDVTEYEGAEAVLCPDTPIGRLVSKLQLDLENEEVREVVEQALTEEEELKGTSYTEGYDEGLYDKENK